MLTAFWIDVSCNISTISAKSAQASLDGWSAAGKEEKLYNQIPKHKKNGYKRCYRAWSELERRLSSDRDVDNLVKTSNGNRICQMYNIMKRIIDVILFLGERGLAFRDSSQHIGDISN